MREVAITDPRLPSGDAVPHGANTAKLLDIDVDEFARVLALVAPDRFSWLQGAELVQAEPTQTRLTVAGDTPVSAAICLPVQRWRRSFRSDRQPLEELADAAGAAGMSDPAIPTDPSQR